MTDLCATGLYATGGQVSIRAPGLRCDVAAGLHHDGRPILTSDVAEVFCLTKPLIASAALLCAERTSVDPWRPLRESLPAPGLADRVTLASIVDHSAGLRDPDAFSYILQPPAARPGVTDLLTEPPGTHAYSELAGWLLLERFIQVTSGRPAAQVILDTVCRPLGISDEVILTPEALAAARTHRVMVGRAGLPVDDIPLLHVLSSSYASRLTVAGGGLASARALAVFADALRQALRGKAVEGLPASDLVRAIDAGGPGVRDDRTWGRQASFGFAMEITDRSWRPAAPPGSHRQLTSGVATGFTALDLDRDLTWSFVLNGVSTTATDVHACRDDLHRTLEALLDTHGSSGA